LREVESIAVPTRQDEVLSADNVYKGDVYQGANSNAPCFILGQHFTVDLLPDGLSNLLVLSVDLTVPP
jgi:hypothetical protein